MIGLTSNMLAPFIKLKWKHNGVDSRFMCLFYPSTSAQKQSADISEKIIRIIVELFVRRPICIKKDSFKSNGCTPQNSANLC